MARLCWAGSILGTTRLRKRLIPMYHTYFSTRRQCEAPHENHFSFALFLRYPRYLSVLLFSINALAMPILSLRTSQLHLFKENLVLAPLLLVIGSQPCPRMPNHTSYSWEDGCLCQPRECEHSECKRQSPSPITVGHPCQLHYTSDPF